VTNRPRSLARRPLELCLSEGVQFAHYVSKRTLEIVNVAGIVERAGAIAQERTRHGHTLDRREGRHQGIGQRSDLILSVKHATTNGTNPRIEGRDALASLNQQVEPTIGDRTTKLSRRQIQRPGGEKRIGVGTFTVGELIV
jgi:hypothetical protein